MRRATIAVTCAAVALGGLLGTASVSHATAASASCVGVVTSYEGSQLPPGSVGHEVSGLARGVPILGATLVSPLAVEHGPACG
jgi:hypothetical protein